MSIYSYENVQFLNNNNDFNELLHENLIELIHRRDKRAVEDDTTMDYDGSGSMTIEPITNPTVVSMTFQSTREMMDQSTIGLTTDQTSIPLTTIFTSSTSETMTPDTLTTLANCNTETYIYLPNGTCALKTDIQILTVNILRSDTDNSTIIAYALSLYISSVTNTNISSNPSYILSPHEIDEYLESLSDTTLIIDSTTSFIMVQQSNQQTNVTILGALYTHNIGGEIIDNTNQNNVYNRNLTAAAIIHSQSLVDVTSLNVFIIDTPTTYQNIDNTSNTTLVSSVIVVTVERNSSVFIPMNISLYFQVLNEYRPTVDGIYSCSYYDKNTSRWSDFGCTKHIYNIQFNRYECNCNHLSTFALISSPNITCNTDVQIQLSNGSCVLKSVVQTETVNTLRSNTTNSTVIADALSLYISSITNSNTSLNSNNTLSIDEIDTYLDKINVNVTKNTTDSILVVQSPYQEDNVIILGASFTRGVGGELVKNTNKYKVTSSILSAAAIISNESLSGVTSLNMLIIDKPSTYRNIDNTTNKTLASSLILATVKRKNSSFTPMNISLYFQVIDEWGPTITNVDYYCSFYDKNRSQWNESGCTKPIYNKPLNRYECSCNHLTSFALLWLPNVPFTTYLTAQDIASLVFQSISILCFLLIIIHAVQVRFRNPLMSFGAYDLLPLISSASTTILFIFYIALGMTVYTKTSSSNEKQCFSSSSVLMFFVYFLLIFMFFTKTSVGYFNYLRFVRLFPQPSHRRLFTMLVISFFISIAWVAFAAGFNSYSSFKITQLYPYKLCWFTRDVVYYFLTLPACLFILINIILFIFVAIHIINHARNATSPHQSYKRMKMCILVLLSSCLTQGIGWFCGVFIQFLNQEGSQVFGWLFIIFNGLEGLWSIILYKILHAKHVDEKKRITSLKDYTKSKSLKPNKYKNEIDQGQTDVQCRDVQPRTSDDFDDLYDVRSISWPSNDDEDDGDDDIIVP